MAKYIIVMPIAGEGHLQVEVPDDVEMTEELAEELFFEALEDQGEADYVEWEFLPHITSGNVCHAPTSSVDWYDDE